MKDDSPSSPSISSELEHLLRCVRRLCHLRHQLLEDGAYVIQTWSPLSWPHSQTSLTVQWVPWSDTKLCGFPHP